MGRIDWREYITVDPDLHHSDPCISGTRIPVATVVGGLADGMTSEEILEAYPQLTRADIQAALAYAADVVEVDAVLTNLDALASAIGERWQGKSSAVEAIRDTRRRL